MARTKETARKSGDKDPKVAVRMGAGKGKKMSRLVSERERKRAESGRGRRVSVPSSSGTQRRRAQHSAVLTEIRTALRNMQLAIPRVQFQRLVRSICQRHSLPFRWQASALGALQQGSEDWLINMFQDSYILAAHAHRVTVMPRDVTTLRMVRGRFEYLLKTPNELGDVKMKKILEVPSLVKKVKVTEVTGTSHNYDTRQRREELVAEEAEREEELRNEQEAVRKAAARLHAQNVNRLRQLLPGFNVHVSIRESRNTFPFEQEEIRILRIVNKEVTDKVMIYVLRYHFYAAHLYLLHSSYPWSSG